MKLAFVHYHLRPGGVTRVIESQVAALRELGHEALVLHGDPARSQLSQRHLPALDYSQLGCDPDPAALERDLLAAAHAHFGSAPDLWHFHNHSLGLNPSLSRLPARLASAGHRLLLQTHDFAEDGRPANFQRLRDQARLFPHAPQVHYACLNSRDQKFLQQAGLPGARAHLLPNPINPPALPPRVAPPAAPLVFYPVRGIRRKNLGEAVLLAALAPAGTRFAVAIAPDETSDLAHHAHWQEFARRHDIPIEFDVADRLAPVPGAEKNFLSWLAHATHLLTTSVAEGFGLTFLEALAWQKPLIGRNLPEITADFQIPALAENLYASLPLPASLFPAQELEKDFHRALQEHHETYGLALDSAQSARAWQRFKARADFANLPEPHQEKIILRARAEGLSLPNLPRIDLRPPDRPSPELSSYRLPAYCERLLSLYQNILDNPPAEPEYLDRAALRAPFLAPERFHFLRS